MACAVAGEAAQFGVRLSIVQMGGYDTGLFTTGAPETAAAKITELVDLLNRRASG
ncbi:hypothetical protein ACI2LC_37530 [Nonomuraea wenchangensis]|uniref:hypothetical protein n=1 Tax=Nonomuraea wenchangensis TaxID=568860 RepID=UPI00384F0E07